MLCDLFICKGLVSKFCLLLTKTGMLRIGRSELLELLCELEWLDEL